MIKIAVLIFCLLLTISCGNEDSFPVTETITSGTKWTLKIGSPKEEVYSQLQNLGAEKNFDDVAIAFRKSFVNPEEIKSDLNLYRAITLESPSPQIERVLIQFENDKVKSIQKGGALLTDISKWPENIPESFAIHINDPVKDIHQKLVVIYQDASYKDHKITLSDKWLAKPYDPDMVNYDEWYFTFSTNLGSSKSGTSAVNLFFSNNRLVKIQHHYNEGIILN